MVIDNLYLIEATENADKEQFFDVLEGKIKLYAPQLIYYELGNVTLMKAKKNTIKENRKYFLCNLLQTINIKDCDFVKVFEGLRELFFKKFPCNCTLHGYSS